MTPSDFAECAQMIRGGSRTFHAASLVFPRAYSTPALAVYAFCRVADDLIDRSEDPRAALADLRDRLDRIYAGDPVNVPADRAFAHVVERFAIPRVLPEALLEGFEWDAQNRRYGTLDDLTAYAVRVAGTVGGMMALLMGRREPSVLARAIDLGVAMQLTNIARDVGEDARAGRLYLPLQWLRDAGLDPDAFVANPRFSRDLATVVRRLLRSAEAIYERADAGIAHLPASCRPAIAAARTLYAEIGEQVARNGFDSVTRRAVVPAARKLSLAATIAARSIGARQGLATPPLPEARFLLAAVGNPAAARPLRTTVPWWRFADRTVWVLQLFERLERREQVNRSNA
jgi:phytoene synthase